MHASCGLRFAICVQGSGALNRSCLEENSCVVCFPCYFLVLWVYHLGGDTCVRNVAFPCCSGLHGPGAMGRPPLPPGQDKKSRDLAGRRVSDAKRRASAVQRRSTVAMYRRTYRQKRVLEVMSSQDSCASTVSSGDSSVASSGIVGLISETQDCWTDRCAAAPAVA